MSGGGAAAGMVAGGLLTTCLSWRWVLFVNVPIGLLVAAAAPFVLAGSARRRGRSICPGRQPAPAGWRCWCTACKRGHRPGGRLPLGRPQGRRLTRSGPGAAGQLRGHRVTSGHALMPLRIFASRSRSGAYVIMLLIATAMSGFFFFLTIFVQDVLGYSALKAGMAFLPFAGTLVVIWGLAGQLVPGRRPATDADGHGGHQRRHVLVLPHRRAHRLRQRPARPEPAHRRRAGPAVRAAVAGRAHRDPRPGLRCRLQPAQRRPAGRRRDRPGRTRHRGLDSGRGQRPQPDRGRSRPARPLARQPPARASVYHYALAAGITRGFLAASGIALAALVTTAVTTRIRREDRTSPAAAARAAGQRAARLYPHTHPGTRRRMR